MTNDSWKESARFDIDIVICSLKEKGGIKGNKFDAMLEKAEKSGSEQAKGFGTIGNFVL